MLKIVSVEYEIEKKTFKAVVLGVNEKDAINFLAKQVGKKIKINSIMYDKQVHAVTDNALEYMDNQRKPKPKVIVDTEEPSTDAPEAGIQDFKCIECDKSFKTESALKAHNTRFHSEQK